MQSNHLQGGERVAHIDNCNAVCFIQNISLSPGLKADYFNQVHHLPHAKLGDRQQREALIYCRKAAAPSETAGREGKQTSTL